MSGIMVESTTQRIIVNPAISSIGVINTGPMGPTGPTGPAEALTVLDTDGDILTRESGILADITRAALAADVAFSDVYMAKTLLTADGQILTRVAGVPAPITRASLAADTAFSSLYAPTADLGSPVSYTPVIGGSGWALGNGTIIGKYSIRKKNIRVRGKFTAGSTSTFGASQLTVTLPPFTAATTNIRNVGQVVIVAATVHTAVAIVQSAGTTILFYSITSSTGALGSLVQNAPATLANGHTIEWDIEYETV